MACDVVSSPFHETSAFEEDWQKAVTNGSDDGGLGLIAEFNASCDNNSTAFGGNNATANDGGIDPALLTNATASPEPSTDVFDHDFSAQGDFSYPDFNQPTSANTPYFHSNENQLAPPAVPMFASSPLRNQLHRRSVSEPPDAFPHHHQHHHQQDQIPIFIPSGPPMTLTRAGHYLGQPKPAEGGPRMMKSLPKTRSYRGHPYARGQPTQRSSSERYDFRHPRLQPVHAHTMGPTSVPPGVYMPSPPQPQPQPQPQIMQQPYTTSRVCTPAPSPVRSHTVGSPGPIDPMLSAVPPEKKIVSIPVKELRNLITDAVRKAVEGIEAVKKTAGEATGHEESHADAEDVDEDEIVIASVEGREGEF